MPLRQAQTRLCFTTVPREILLSSASADSFCENTAFMVHVKFIAHDELFRAVFTRCPDDLMVWLLDVRSQNKFKRGHIMSAFCIRATANGDTLLVSCCDYNLLLWSTLFHQEENSFGWECWCQTCAHLGLVCAGLLTE